MPGRSTFAAMCDELSNTAVPQLVASGFTQPKDPFSRHALKYEFTRPTDAGVHVVEILFNKYRQPLFQVQIYIAPSSGVSGFVERGGSLILGSVSSSRRRWPFPVRPFHAEPTRLQRLLGQRGNYVRDSVQQFLSLLPEIEGWWVHQRSTAHITKSTLTYPGTRRDRARRCVTRSHLFSKQSD